MTALSQDDPELPVRQPFRPRTRWHRRRGVRIGTVLAVVAILAGLVVWRPWVPVRVTDGSVDLVDYLNRLDELVLAENDRVAGSGQDFVSIAFMLPIRTGDTDPNTATSIRHELEGAYLAQWWANHENGDPDRFDSSRPLVRLLLADTGDVGVDWRDTVDDLAGLVDGDEHLVAVAGLGSSVDTTQAAVNELNAKGIPMFGAVITSSVLSAPLLARVSPTNADEAGAAVQYLRTTAEWTAATAQVPFRSHLIRDTDPTNGYAADLAARYRDEFPKDDPNHPPPSEGGFNAAAGAVGNVLAVEAQRICGIGPNVVFFAGRSADLKTFLAKLDQRDCPDLPVTIIAGDDVDRVTGVRDLWTGNNIKVLYTALATPQAWNSAAPGSRDLFSTAPINRFQLGPVSYAALFHDDLEDGQAIMGYDAMIAAIEATRRARTEQTKIPRPGDLVNGLNQINGTARVPGASGWIYFQIPADSGQQWLPDNKLVPVMNLDADGRSSLVVLSSRNGNPPGPPPR